MEALRELFLTLGLDADEARFATATAAVDLLEKGLDLAAAAAKALGAQLVETVVGTAEYAGTVGDASTMTGVGVERLQELSYAAVQSGTDIGEVTQSLTFLNRNLAAAAHDSGEAAKAFARLGIATRGANGEVRDTYAVFLDAAQALSRLPPGAERSALAMDLFGRSGARLLPLFADGAEGLKAMALEARAMGAVMSADAVVASKRFGDDLAALQFVAQGVRHELGALLINELEPLVTGVKQWVQANRQLISQKLKSLAEGIAGALKALLALMKSVAAAAQVLAENWKLIGIVLGSFVLAKFVLLNAALLEQLVAFGLNTAAAVLYGGTMVATGLRSAAAWAAAVAPVVLTTAALALLGLILEDIWVFAEGGDSALGHLIYTWSQPLPGDSDIVAGLKAMVRGLADIEEVMLPALKDAWRDLWAFVRNSAKGVFYDLKAQLADLLIALGRIPGFRGIAQITAGAVLGGGAASPAAQAQSTSSTRDFVRVVQPNMRTNFVINAAPGQSEAQIASEAVSQFDDWWDAKLNAVPNALPGSGG